MFGLDGAGAAGWIAESCPPHFEQNAAASSRLNPHAVQDFIASPPQIPNR